MSLERLMAWVRECMRHPAEDGGKRPAWRSSPFRPSLETLEGRLSPAVLTVSTLDDDGPGSLRQAIAAANTFDGPDVIQFAPDLQGTISLGSALPELAGAVAIEGPGASLLSVRPVLDVNLPFFRVFAVQEPATVIISGLTITGGRASFVAGGGISNAGNLTLREVSVVDTQVPGMLALQMGGAIFNSGTLTIADSTVANNFGVFSSAGGIVNTGTLTITSSTIAGNRTQGVGGTTIGGVPLAAGIHNEGTLSISGSTVTGNSSVPGRGGYGLGAGILNAGGTATLFETIVAQNGFDPSPEGIPTAGEDVFGSFISLGNNVIGDGSGATGFGAEGDRVGTAASPIDPEPEPPPDSDPDEETPSEPDPAAEAAAQARRHRAALVAALYNDLLGRQVDPQGESHWTGKLESGVSHQAVAQAIMGSPEHRERVVRLLYLSLLEREADATGLAAFSTALAQGATIAQVKASILGSVEYNRNLASDDAFLRSLYQVVLGRDVDPGARTAFTAQLSGGTSRGIVALNVLRSAEASALLVRADYQKFLRREADPTGLTSFVDVFQRGGKQEEVILVMAGSPEYAALFPG